MTRVTVKRLPQAEKLGSDIVAMVERIAREVDQTLGLRDAEIFMPAVWFPRTDGCGNAAVEDPLTVYIDLGVPGDLGCEAHFSFDLRDGLREYIEQCGVDGSFSVGLALIAAELRALADQIDGAMSQGPESGGSP